MPMVSIGKLWTRCRALISVFTTVLTVLYPFVVSLILTHPDTAKPFAGVLIYLGLVKILPLSKVSRSPIPTWVSRAMGASMLLIGVWVTLGGKAVGLQVYPIAINVCFLALFASSLNTGKSMIERFASLYEKNITPRKRVYMRKITFIWCVFFVVNMVISVITWLAMSTSAWAWYNGVISYVLMGCLFAGEYIYRRLVFLKNND